MTRYVTACNYAVNSNHGIFLPYAIGMDVVEKMKCLRYNKGRNEYFCYFSYIDERR